MTVRDFGCATSNSTNTATITRKSEHFVRVTHPFHPYSGKRLLCVGVRYNRYGKRLILRVAGSKTCSVPPQWTDEVPADPEVVLGKKRAHFRVADLLELEKMLEGLSAPTSAKKRRGRP